MGSLCAWKLGRCDCAFRVVHNTVNKYYLLQKREIISNIIFFFFEVRSK